MADSESSTIVFPFPIDVIRPFLEGVTRNSAASRGEREAATGGNLPSSRSSPANPARATR